MAQLVVVMAQVNPLVGDIDGNAAAIIARSREAVAAHEAPVVVFPELTLSGYPPEDLLLRPSIERRVEQSLERILAAMTGPAWAVIGYPRRQDGVLYNVAGVLHRGKIIAEYRKQELPNYQVFDEKRYFRAGTQPCVVEIAGVRVGLSICEDIWEEGPTLQAAAAGAQLLLNINSSPYHRGKRAERWDLSPAGPADGGLPIVYVNQVGGQDELVFDGGSFAVTADGEVAAAAPISPRGSTRLQATFGSGPAAIRAADRSPLEELAAIWQALVLGVRDYVNKNRFRGVVLGLSGGIDSALTLAVAVEALGPDRVEAVMMPFRYTAQMSVEDAAAQARLLGVKHKVISIEPIYEAFMASLAQEFAGTRRRTPPRKTCRRAAAACC